MKILIVHPSFWIDGGAEKVIVRLANYLTEHNIDNSILTTQMLPEIKKQLTETRIIECGDYNVMSQMLQTIANDFDVINIHNEPCQLMIYPKHANYVWSFNELPQKIQLGGNLDPIEINIVKNFINKIVVADEANKRKIKIIYGKDSNIVPYGIDYDFFQEREEIRELSMRNTFNLEKDDFVITQVGFIAPTKNQVETVKIFAEVKKKIPNAKLILAGLETPYKKDVEREIMKNKVYGDVYFAGKLSHEEVRDLLHISNVTIQPNKGQGSWLSVFESLACEVPVLVSDEFTGQEIIAKLKNAVACSNIGEYVAMIEAMSEVHEMVSINEDKKWIRENLTWDNYCKKMVEVFNESLIN